MNVPPTPPADEEVAIDLPVLQIALEGVPWSIVKTPSGVVGLKLGPFAMHLVVPLTPAGASSMGAQLSAAGSGIVIPELNL